VTGGTAQARADDRSWGGRAASQWGGGSQREVLGPGGADVSVADPCMPSGDSPRDSVECVPAAAGVALTRITKVEHNVKGKLARVRRVV